MLDLVKVAVTGGISSGKSQFCSYLLKLGAYVVSADKIVHQLLSPDTDLGKKVIKLLGPNILVDDEIDRNRIAQRVFKDSKLLKSLEEILHPSVMKEIELEYQKANKDKKAPLFVAEIPLLFEVGADKRFDRTIAVIANKNRCIERFIATTGKDQSEYERRAAMQLSQEKKAELADIIIENNGSLEDLYREAEKTFNVLTD